VKEEECRHKGFGGQYSESRVETKAEDHELWVFQEAYSSTDTSSYKVSSFTI